MVLKSVKTVHWTFVSIRIGFIIKLRELTSLIYRNELCACKYRSLYRKNMKIIFKNIGNNIYSATWVRWNLIM